MPKEKQQQNITSFLVRQRDLGLAAVIKGKIRGCLSNLNLHNSDLSSIKMSSIKQKNQNYMRKYTMEFIGTFFLVTGVIYGGAIGATLALLVMVYAGGHILGAHYNPAVTVAMYMRGKVSTSELPGYFIAQLLGGAVSALLIFYVFEKEGFTRSCDGFENGILKTALAEVIGTFALAFVVLNVATARGTAGNSYFGLAIAGTVLAMALTIGRYSGGVFNPAVGFGLSVHESLCWANLWMFFAAPVVGGVLAAIVFKIVNVADDEHESIPEEPVIRIEDNSQRSE